MSNFSIPSQFQTLELADRYFDDVFSGKKRNTQRYQEKAIEKGFLVFESSNDPNLLALVWVEKVDYIQLQNVGKIVPGSPSSSEELLSGMRRHYPDIELNSTIMVVHHLSPFETYKQFEIPRLLNNIFGPEYLEKLKKYS